MSDYSGHERRANAPRFDVKSEILSAIAKTEDQTVKSILLIMLGVLEEIGAKIDAVMNDETALRETVLNGHSNVHSKHHEWISVQLTKEEKNSGSFRKIGEGLAQTAIWCGLTSFVTYLLMR